MSAEGKCLGCSVRWVQPCAPASVALVGRDLRPRRFCCVYLPVVQSHQWRKSVQLLPALLRARLCRRGPGAAAGSPGRAGRCWCGWNRDGSPRPVPTSSLCPGGGDGRDVNGFAALGMRIRSFPSLSSSCFSSKGNTTCSMAVCKFFFMMM